MKNLFYLILSFTLINCVSESPSCPTELSSEAKEIDPYTMHQNIEMKDQDGNRYLGVVSAQATNKILLGLPGVGCELYELEEKEDNITFENFKLVSKLKSSPEQDKISFEFQYIVNDVVIRYFDIYDIPVNAFRDIIYDGKNFENVIIAYARSGYINAPVILLFSKNNGIEYIQFSSNKTLQLVHE